MGKLHNVMVAISGKNWRSGFKSKKESGMSSCTLFLLQLGSEYELLVFF